MELDTLNGFAHVIKLDTLRSPFTLHQLVGTDVLVHEIDLQTVVNQDIVSQNPGFFANFSDEAARLGYRVVHLWEDVRQLRPALVQSRLNALAGRSVRIPARLTQLRRIDQPTARAFLAEHHLQGVTTAKYSYGLWLPARYFRVLPPDFLPDLHPAEDWLVAVATFSQPRQIPRNGQPSRSFELIRFANYKGCTVVGGLDKLLRGVARAHVPPNTPADVMTYADRDWSDGRGYARLGFDLIGATPPQQFWLDPATLVRHHPHRLPAPDAVAAGFLPIVNAGSLKFVRIIGH